MADRTQHDETIERSKDAVAEELTPDEAHRAHRKEGTEAVHHASGQRTDVGREGGRTDHVVLDNGENVPRHPHG